VVEIGSWKGRSTVAIALGLRARGNGRVYAIDPHTGSKEHVEVFGAIDTFGTFVQNIRDAGVSDFVEALRTSSHEARARFSDNSISVLFVDGSHEYVDVIRDIEDWIPALNDRAVIAFNDPLLPGVYRALRETVLINATAYRKPRYIANTLFFTFDRAKPWSRLDALWLIWLRSLLALRYRLQDVAIHMPVWAIRLVRWGYQRLLF